ncbi:hypothetical protein HDU91_000604 [Kappamyces sp. JEL0680]|nr:hypothetical protein HDU91_000604 [Kappamyces sp. JEL0680]
MHPYEPLADEHLQDYFNSPHTRSHLIEEDGTVVDEKKFKKTQIQLDKLRNEERLSGQQLKRELDHGIEPGRDNPEYLTKYPISMQTTAVIYTAVPPLPGTSRKHKSNTKATSKSAKHEREASLVELFETAKSEYRPGKHEESDEGLRSILKTAVPKPDGPQDGGPGGEKKPTSTRIIRPKSARPTRNSAFPVASAFSEAGSDGESDINDYEVDGLVDGETAQEVVATSTIVGPAAKPSQKPAKSKPSPKGAAASDQNHAGHGKGTDID